MNFKDVHACSILCIGNYKTCIARILQWINNPEGIMQ